MNSTYPHLCRIFGAALCLLGLEVLLGWLLSAEPMVRVVPGSPAMAINTALMFVLSGLCLLMPLGPQRGAWKQALYDACTVVLIVLPIAVLVQHVFNVDLGIDLAEVHAALGDGHAKPGRTAPNASLAFLLAGISLLLWRKHPANNTQHRKLRLALAGIVMLIGVLGLIGYFLRLEAMYQLASYNKMATLTALGTSILGMGLWTHGTKAGDQHDVQNDATRITSLSATLLTLFAITAGLAGFAILRHGFEKAAATNLYTTATTNAFSIGSALEHVHLLSKSVAHRASLKSALRDLDAGLNEDEALTKIESTLLSFVEQGFSSVQVYSANDDLLASAGKPQTAPGQIRVALASETLSELLWADELLLRSHHDITQGNRVVGRVVVERRLSGITDFLKKAQYMGETSDAVLCGRAGNVAVCFPSRVHKEGVRIPMFKQDGSPALPVSHALLGRAGSSSAVDLRGLSVLAGYAPVSGFDLAVVVKTDVTELYAPLRDRLNLLTLALIAFVAVGTLLIWKLVRPLVARIVSEQQRMKAILDNSNDAFIALGSNGLVTDWNRQAENMLGWSAKEAIGKDLAELIIPQAQRNTQSAGFNDFLNTAAGPIVNHRTEICALHKSGAEIPIEISISPFHDGQGYAASAFLRDLSQQKEAERKEREQAQELQAAQYALAQSQKLEAVGKLTGGVAHDFNNVLQVIKGSLQLLQAENESSYKREKRVDAAIGAADRGAKLAAQLLAFARKQPLQPKTVNLERLVRSMGELTQRVLGGAVEIETVVAGGLWNTFVDPHQLENVILNLAINARDAMDGQGKLTIEVSNATLDDDYARCEPGLKAGQYVLLAISDTGCGMPPEVKERVFEPFFTTKKEGEGTGLGLSMAYGFVKQSEGHIGIYSEVGHGTTVKIYLPRSFEHAAHEVVPPVPTIDGGSETILVVEDDIAVQTTVTDMLSSLGYRVLKAGNAEMALDTIKDLPELDLLFTDVVMPGPVRSPELAERAKARFPRLQVLFTSGYTQNGIVHGGRLDPGVHLLSKPYGRDQLARKVRQLLDASKQTGANPAPAEAVTAPQEPVQPQEQRQEQGSALAIAFVEDNDDFRQLAAEMLAILGYRVESFANAQAALQRIASSPFDLLLTDVSLPGMSGVELASRALKLQPTLRVVLASGYGKTAGANADFEFSTLAKPFSLSQLQACLAGELSGSAL